MKKNRIIRIASLLFVAVIISTCAISGTFAKYTSSVNGSDTARVAKWEFEFGTDETTIGQDLTFDLFNTTYTNVESNDTDNVVAPGTDGSFAIQLANVSEVAAKYTIVLSETQTVANQIPIEYSLDPNASNPVWTSDISTLNASLADIAIAMDGTATQTIYWRWVFEVDDNGNSADTTLGLAGTAEVTVTANVTVTQVD